MVNMSDNEINHKQEETVFKAEALTVEFKSRAASVHRALDGLSFELKRGDTLSVVGESGSGKSTLLRAAAALIAPTAGRVELFGHDTARLPLRELNALRQRCGYVPQDPYGAIPPGLSVIEAAAEPLLIAGRGGNKDERRRAAAALLAEFGLTGERILASRAVGLSGGQRQRAELARALILEPELLLCDEPTSMQDASTRGEIIEILNRRTARGMSMIFVTHDLMLAAHAAKRMIVLKDGRLCEAGSSEEVLRAPQHPYTKALLAALPKAPTA